MAIPCRDPYFEFLDDCTSLHTTDSAIAAQNQSNSEITSSSVCVVACNELSTSQFSRDFMGRNQPVLVTVREFRHCNQPLGYLSMRFVGMSAGDRPRLEVLG